MSPRVATDRYRKKIREDDRNRADANYAKAALAGAALGAALHGKIFNRPAASLTKRALAGAGGGLLAQGVVRTIGRDTKDAFGERSNTAKRSEKIPMYAAGLAAAIIGSRRFQKVAKAHRLSRFEFAGDYYKTIMRAGTISPSLKRKLIVGASLAGGITVADVASSAAMPEDTQTRQQAALQGAKRGAIYGGVLAGVEPLLHSNIVRGLKRVKLSRPIFFIRQEISHEEDLASQRRRLAVLGGGVLAGAGGLELLARSGKKSVVANEAARAARKMPEGRKTLDRTAKFNSLLQERGYIHLKPMDPRQRKRFDKLAPDVQGKAGKLSKWARNPGFTPGERRGLRQAMGVFRKKYNFARGDMLARSRFLHPVERAASTGHKVILNGALAREVPGKAWNPDLLAKIRKKLAQRATMERSSLKKLDFARGDMLARTRYLRPIPRAASTGHSDILRSTVAREIPDVPGVWTPELMGKIRKKLAERAMKERAAKKLSSVAELHFSAFVKDVAFKELPAAVRRDISAFVKAKPGTLFSHYGMVVKELLHKADPHNLKSARANVAKLSHKAARNEVHERRATKHILVNNDRIVDGHHFLAKAERGGVTGSLHVIDLTPSRFQFSRRLILFKRQQLRDEDGDRFSNPLMAAATGTRVYVNTGPGPNDRIRYGGDYGAIPIAHGQVLRAAYNKARGVHKWGGRGVNAVRDISDVVGGRPRRVDYAGRPQKREWEKSYAKRGAETALIGAAGLGLVVAAKKYPHIAEKIAFKPIRNARARVNRWAPDIFASRRFVRPLIELAAVRTEEERARREDREHKLRLATGITTIGAGATVGAGAIFNAVKQLKASKQLKVAKVLLAGAYKAGKLRATFGHRYGLSDSRSPILFAFGKLAKRAAIIGGSGAAIGVGAALLRSPGRPLKESEDVNGKLVWRRSKTPLIRHYGVGIEGGRVAHVQAGRVGGRATFKIEPTEKFSAGRSTYVERTRRTADSAEIEARVRQHNRSTGKFSLIRNNCEIAGNTVLGLRKPNSQVRDSVEAAAIGGGAGATAALLVSPARKLLRRARGVRLERGSTPLTILFDAWAEQQGWDVRDPRGRSARVYAPGSRKRERREKEWHETVRGQKLIRNILVGGGLALGAGGGALAGMHIQKKFLKHRGVKLPVEADDPLKVIRHVFS